MDRYLVVGSDGRELSEATTLRAACAAVRMHLNCDGETPPLFIYAPDGTRVAEGKVDECDSVVIRTLMRGRDLTEKYDKEVIARWGVRLIS